jgi:hypothetical protein
MDSLELLKKYRKDTLIELYRIIATLDFDEMLSVIEELRCVHDNLMAFNPDTGLLAKIESVCLNGECIQLNIEGVEKDE